MHKHLEAASICIFELILIIIAYHDHNSQNSQELW